MYNVSQGDYIIAQSICDFKYKFDEISAMTLGKN